MPTMLSTPEISFESIVPHIEFPAAPAPGPASRLSLLFQLEQTQWWSHERLREAQFMQLQGLLAHAAHHVPHYARTLGRAEDLPRLTPETWAQLPLLTRHDLRPGNRQMLSGHVPPEHGRRQTNPTSGSTGTPIECQSTDLTQFFWKVFALREHVWHRRDFTRKLMVIRYVKENPEKAAGGLRAEKWGAATDDVIRTGPVALYDLRADLSFLAERLIAERPGYLLGHPSALSGLIDQCERRGVKPEGLLQLRAIGEMVPDDLGERSQRLWGTPLVDVYSCQEAGYLAVQCPDHPHLHVQSENVLLEVIDGEGRACQPGEIGRVVITSLNNFATPLIRYELGDYARVGGPCPCGRGLPVLERVMGRSRNLVTLPSGDTRWPRVGYEELRTIAPVGEIQMIQHSLEDIEVRLVVHAPLTPLHYQALTAYVQRNLGHPFRIRFELVDSIRHAVNGKVEAFISKLPARPA
jgi:phenylacetate-CoA ligase